MKKKLLMSLGLLLIAALGVSVAKLEMTKTKETLTSKIERWQSLGKNQILSTLKNDQGLYLNSVSLTREDITTLLNDSDKPTITFHLSVNKNGEFGFVLTSTIETKSHQFLSRLPDLNAKASIFDANAYSKSYESSSSMLKEHLIDLNSAIEEIEKWEKASNNQRFEALITENGERLRSLSYNKEVLYHLLAQPDAVSITSFLALNDEGNLRFVTMGVDQLGNLLVPDKNNNNYGLFQYLHPCPPFGGCDCPEGMEEGPGGICLEMDKS